jgi:hypothetical protein
MAKLDGMDPKLVREMLADLQGAAKRLDTLDARIAQLTRGAGVAVQATHHPSEVADACRGMVKDVTDRLALLEKQEKQRRQGGNESSMTIVSSPAPIRAVTSHGPRETGREPGNGAGPKREPATRPPEKREPVRPKSKGDPMRPGHQPGDTKPGDTKPEGSKPDDSKPGDSKPGDTKPGGCLPGESRPGEREGAQGGWSGTPHGRVSDSGKHRRRPHAGPDRAPHGDATHDPQRPDGTGTPGGPDEACPTGSGPRSAPAPAGATAGLERDPAVTFDPATTGDPTTTRHPATAREPYLVLGSPVPEGPFTVPGDLDQRSPAGAGADPRTPAAAGTWQGIPLPSTVQPVDVVSYPTGRSGDDMSWVLVDRGRETGSVPVPGPAAPTGEGPSGAWGPMGTGTDGRWMPVRAEPHGDRPQAEGYDSAQADPYGDRIETESYGRHARDEAYGEHGEAGPSGGGRHRSAGPADVRERPWGDRS